MSRLLACDQSGKCGKARESYERERNAAYPRQLSG